MDDRTPVIVDCDLYTAFGPGVEACWNGLLSNQAIFSDCSRFHNEKFSTSLAALAPGADVNGTKEIPGFFLDYLAPTAKKMPRDAELFLASTVGEIEYIDNPEHRCTCDMLLERALNVCDKDHGRIISAACASSNSAFVSLSHHIRSGRLDSAVVIGTDYVSEFLFSGFATLRALARTIARPYDRNRDGLLLGDAASIVNICSAKKAAELGMEPRAALVSGGMSCDAVHITAPMPHGEALSEAIVHALDQAGLSPDDIGAVIGHGTGTRYNDDMEIQAIHRVFGERAVPMLSVKGACGHTLAGAGLVEAVVGVRILETGLIPPQTSLLTPEPEAARYVSQEIRRLERPHVLCMNSGFGGLNAVIILEAAS